MVTLSVQFLLINSVEGFFLISFYILHNISATLFTSKTKGLESHKWQLFLNTE